jgi:two-component system chemotaxis response regulator CheY
VKILVVDDDPTSRAIVEATLTSVGHRFEAVVNGDQAWDAFTTGDFDVVISDWTMPGQTGLELCANIRRHPSGSYAYIILVTKHGDIDQVLEGMAAGADDYLVKPLNPESLRARLIAAGRVSSLHRELEERQATLEVLNVELAAIARRDPLTGLRNRRALDEDIAVLEALVARYGHRYCMAVVDVDHFKAYNDTYGHQAGDHALETLAKVLQANARTGDALYRYGGEEFLCIFPEQSLATGAQAVERMRIALEKLAIPHVESATGVLTISAGMAILEPGETRPLSEVLGEADASLYRAKALGRNRIEHGVVLAS